jgi:6,7-dimethyl-8-ribityllumazine synthase
LVGAFSLSFGLSAFAAEATKTHEAVKAEEAAVEVVTVPAAMHVANLAKKMLKSSRKTVLFDLPEC